MATNKDGGLRPIFRHQFKTWQWSTIEVGATQGGLPDNEFCTPEGIQGWIELKQTHIFYVKVKPLQVAWLMRRCRYGGNAWIAVRRTPQSQKEIGIDQLWLMKGDQAANLATAGLQGIDHYTIWEGGPSNWNFAEIGHMLSHFAS